MITITPKTQRQIAADAVTKIVAFAEFATKRDGVPPASIQLHHGAYDTIIRTPAAWLENDLRPLVVNVKISTIQPDQLDLERVDVEIRVNGIALVSWYDDAAV